MGGIPLGRIAGFPVTANWSVLVILWLFTWSLASTLPSAVSGYSAATYWFAGACGAVVLLASLLAHELAHAIVARRAGVKVIDVTLWLFGGITRLGGQAKTPQTAFRIAVSGPVTSLALAAGFAAAAAGLATIGGPDIATSVFWWLAGINLLLGLFNLLPGSPLDGGQVLRAWLWRRYGDPVRAAVGAARAGRALALVLIGLGFVEFLAGAFVAGIWLAFIGWFIFTAAHTDETQILARNALTGVRVADTMTAHPHTAPAGITVADFIERYLLGDRHSAYPVQDRDGSISGLVTLTQLRQVPPGRRGETLVGEIAVPLDRVPTAAPNEPVTALLERLSATQQSRALVVDEGRVVGIVTASDLTRLVDVYRLARPRADSVETH
ncbi:site-2 protease family protein [Mycobacterium branderi]|uniref:Zinc metalloprotease n=1 Tax=Mycobacterium branderi TaxID=43348 RepID=A0A7I7W6P2_9MYCO|nr:site-2 protease family protein [Mycobacterium branderi]MCV7231131.1 CBS domain-containing protein [Mycobacterium branderi]ORA35707.1 site-2 protease family protein [Mycobacterium branderi]BBZ12750.1 putative zinc metalloprotease Rip3 [Mycobacterium branderi]